jgi:hypothetical protein
MEVPKNFSFYGVKKTLPQGEYEGVIAEFIFAEKTSKAGNPYTTLSVKVDVNGGIFIVNLSLDPKEKGKATNRLIMQLVDQTGKTEQEIIDMCQVPNDFFRLAEGKTIKLTSTEKGYIDVSGDDMPVSKEVVNPNDIPF